VLNESLAIMAYLDRAFPAPSIFGESAHEAARNWRLISEFFSYLYGPLNRIVTPLYAGKTAEKADDIRAALPVVHEELGGSSALSATPPGSAAGPSPRRTSRFTRS